MRTMATDLTQPVLAISGATGAVGGRIASRLAGLGHVQRLIVRDTARAPRLPGAEVTEGSYEDPEAMRKALEGMRTFFMVSAGESSDRVRTHTAAVDAAVEAGVERIVYLSFVGAAPEATSTLAREHWRTEEHVRSTGLKHTFLRDNAYLDYVPALVGSDGVIRGPADEGRVGAVARDDVAEVAVAVLLGEGYDGRTYDVTGPETSTLREAAEELSQASGRRISYYPETLEEAYASRSSYGAPEWEVERWVTSYTAIANGEMDVVSATVGELTGHPPMGLAEFLRRYPESYRHLLGT
jgi:NAD(P)H dehydrogenase (quinone)